MTILNSYKISTAAFLLLVGSSVFAQTGTTTDQPVAAPNYPGVKSDWQPSKTPDGVYDRIPHISQPIAWQPIRPTDVLWQKRVWREIDTREKQNVAFRYAGDENSGGGMFIEILIDAIKRGKIKAYSNFDDRFTTGLTKDQLMEQITGKTDTSEVIDPVNQTTTIQYTHHDFDPTTITKFRLKEDWIFDRNEGRMVVRIIGIAPVQDKYGDDGIYRGSQAMFWLYYPDIRGLLAQYEVFNPENDVDRATWDEFFESRQFSSRITKVSSPYSYSNFKEEGLSPMEALYESKNVSDEIFNKEHDMWVY